MALVVGIVPALMALLGQWRARERPSRVFWAASAGGFVAVATYAFTRGPGGGLAAADGLLLVAALAAAWGYAEGGILARALGGRRVICWALLAAAPATIALATLFRRRLAAASTCALSGGAASAGLAYLGLVSMLLAFFAWYRGLARGGIAKASPRCSWRRFPCPSSGRACCSARPSTSRRRSPRPRWSGA
jgi:drug/metabolite transporter (DMT)-like permease